MTNEIWRIELKRGRVTEKSTPEETKELNTKENLFISSLTIMNTENWQNRTRSAEHKWTTRKLSKHKPKWKQRSSHPRIITFCVYHFGVLGLPFVTVTCYSPTRLWQMLSMYIFYHKSRRISLIFRQDSDIEDNCSCNFYYV